MPSKVRSDFDAQEQEADVVHNSDASNSTQRAPSRLMMALAPIYIGPTDMALEQNMPEKLSESQSVFLNFVRGLSAITVLVGHAFSQVEGDFSFVKSMPWQSLAVVVFFWLSGFLIAYNCLTKSKYTFKEYIIDRFARIYVLLVPAIIISVIFSLFFHKKSYTFFEIAGTFLMLDHTPFTRIWSALPTIGVISSNSSLWTIAIEWWLYILFGIIFFFDFYSKRASFISGILLIPSLLVVGYFTLKEYVAWTWIIGAMTGFIFTKFGKKINIASIIFVLVLSIGMICVRFHVIFLPAPGVVNMYDLQLMFCTVIILFSALIAADRIVFSSKMANLGKYISFVSYSLYLFHMPVWTLFFTKFNYVASDGKAYMSLWVALITIVVSFAIAAAIAAVLETRYISLRNFLKRRMGLNGAYPVPRMTG